MLTDTETAVLDLEGKTWHAAGVKESAIRERLDMTPVRYYLVLRGLLNRPEALEHAPVLINRLNRQLARRRRA